MAQLRAAWPLTGIVGWPTSSDPRCDARRDLCRHRVDQVHEYESEVFVYQALLLSGVTGVGKSTIAGAIGRVLSSAGSVTAVVDTDTLAQFGPPPRSGQVPERQGFYDRLKCANLAAVWQNYKAVGAKFIVIAGGIESVAGREQYASCLTGCQVKLVRLVAPTQVVRERLRGRDDGPTLDQHLATLDEQEALHDAARIEDFTVVNAYRPTAEVAREIVARAGWVDPSEWTDGRRATGSPSDRGA
jgi:predicted kinase